MANLGGFDPKGVPPRNAPLPNGDYVAAVDQSGWEKTKDGSGEYLKIVLKILDGPQKGREVVDRINLKNKSQQACQIARSTLAELCIATGVMEPRDSQELHRIPITISVKVDKSKDGDDAYNRVTKYAKKGASMPAATDTPATGAAPWMPAA